MDTKHRPTATTETSRGFPAYDGREIAAWRAALGVTPQEVADRLRVSRIRVVKMEGSPALDANQAFRIIQAVDFYVRRRERLVAKGLADLERIIEERNVGSDSSGPARKSAPRRAGGR